MDNRVTKDAIQTVFNYIWRAKEGEGWGKTTAWNGNGFPVQGNGCGCLGHYALEAGNKLNLHFASAALIREGIVEVHGVAKSPEQMREGMRAIGLKLGLTIPGDDKTWADAKVREVTKLPATA